MELLLLARCNRSIPSISDEWSVDMHHARLIGLFPIEILGPRDTQDSGQIDWRVSDYDGALKLHCKTAILAGLESLYPFRRVL